MSEINWDAEIAKAKMFMLNAYCMKYIRLAEQVNADLKLAKYELVEAEKKIRAYREIAIKYRKLWSEKIQSIGEYDTSESLVDSQFERLMKEETK